MILQTKVNIGKAQFELKPTDRLLFVGSCFAANIGKRMQDNLFDVVVNPDGVMYNPCSICHTIERIVHQRPMEERPFDVLVFTLGTNHVYRDRSTGQIVDNCMKRPQCEFTEELLSIDECCAYLMDAIRLMRQCNVGIRTILTVSPIRYAKYGFHESQLSKATLLLAADRLIDETSGGDVVYFPAYEIMNDELRDYRFYDPDMLHPSAQAVDYIYEQFKGMFFSAEAHDFEREWLPIRKALEHRPFDRDAPEYELFVQKTKAKELAFRKKWGIVR